jgi:sugar phosphate isomerase/epimerase
VKLSISNIAWEADYDDEMYGFLSENNFDGLEIAPTRIFPVTPYDNLVQGRLFARRLREEYGLEISSMQSIWFGVTESVFGSDADRQKLVDYTKKAVDFACELSCSNLVFGNPRNRAIPPDMTLESCLPVAYDFFNSIGNYAASCGICIAIEPNPPIYNTNFINTSKEVFEICRRLDNPGIKINADLGTIIHNNENVGILKDNTGLINHVHISEPRLAPIEKRELHKELKKELEDSGYRKFLSIEMAKADSIDLVKNIIVYIKGIFRQS